MIMLEQSSKEMAINAIKEHLSMILGNSTLMVLNMYMRMNNATLDDIFDKPEEISRCLDKIFGNGSLAIKREIIHVIASINNSINKDSFEDSIRDIAKDY